MIEIKTSFDEIRNYFHEINKELGPGLFLRKIYPYDTLSNYCCTLYNFEIIEDFPLPFNSMRLQIKHFQLFDLAIEYIERSKIENWYFYEDTIYIKNHCEKQASLVKILFL